MAVTNGARGGCGLGLGVMRPFSDLDWWSTSSCTDWRSNWSEQIAAHDPDIVVLHIGFWDTFDSIVDGTFLEVGTPSADSYVLDRLEDAFGVLTSRGATLVLLPIPCFDPDLPPIAGHDLSYEVWRGDHINRLWESFAAAHPKQFLLLDYRSTLCPDGQFAYWINGQQVRTDDGLHLTNAGADAVAKWLEPRLQALSG